MNTSDLEFEQVNPEPSSVNVDIVFSQANTVYDLIELLFDMVENGKNFESEEDLQRLTFVPLSAPEPFREYEGMINLKDHPTADYPFMWKYLLDGAVLVLGNRIAPEDIPEHPQQEEFIKLLKSWCEARTAFFLYTGSSEQLAQFLDSSFEEIRQEQTKIHEALLDRAKSEDATELGFDPEQPIDLQVDNLRELTRINNEQVLDALHANFVTVEVQNTNFVELAQYFRVVLADMFVNESNRTNLDMIRLLSMFTAVKSNNLVLIADFTEQVTELSQDVIEELVENFSRQINGTVTIFTKGRDFIEDFMEKESEKIQQQKHDNQQPDAQ